MSNSRFYEQSLAAGEYMRCFMRRLEQCPVPYTLIQDAIQVKQEHADEFHKWMNGKDEGDK